MRTRSATTWPRTCRSAATPTGPGPTSDLGAKFSKSRGNAFYVLDLVKQFDADAVRYYLAANMPERSDTDWTWPDFRSGCEVLEESRQRLLRAGSGEAVRCGRGPLLPGREHAGAQRHRLDLARLPIWVRSSRRVAATPSTCWIW